MDARQLRYFVQIIELGSFGKASAILRIAQPALSSQIRNLEDELGVQLLIRHSSGVVPTEAGKTLCEHAKAILAHMNVAKHATIDHAEDVAGTVQVGLPPSHCETFGLDIIRKIQEPFPQVEVVLVEGLSAYLQNWLLDGTIDIAVMHEPSPTKLINTRPLYQEDLLLLGAAGGDELPDRIDDLHLLHGLSFVMPPLPNTLTKMLAKKLGDAGIPLDISYKVNTTSVILKLVASGLGYTVLPYLAARSSLLAGTLKAWRLPGEPLYRTMVIAWMNERPFTRALQETKRTIEQTVQDLEPSDRDAFRLIDDVEETALPARIEA